MKNKVPEYNEYFGNIGNAGQKQKSCYKEFVAGIKAGTPIDIQHNDTYVYNYINTLLISFIKSRKFDSFEKKMLVMAEFYPDFKSRIYSIMTDACLLISDYVQAWKYMELGDYRDLAVIGFLSKKVDNIRLSNKDVFNILKSRFQLTKFRESHIVEIQNFIDEILERFHCATRMNIISYFVNIVNRLDYDFDGWKPLFDDLGDYYDIRIEDMETYGGLKNIPVTCHYLFPGIILKDHYQILVPNILCSTENIFRLIFFKLIKFFTDALKQKIPYESALSIAIREFNNLKLPIVL